MTEDHLEAIEQRLIRGEAAAELSRRQFLGRAGALGAGAMIAAAMPTAAKMLIPAKAQADVGLNDAVLQAFFDTMIPGRLATKTDLGNDIHPQAIAGVDPDPGAVEGDALALSQNPKLGFQLLQGVFLPELEAFALLHGGEFLSMSYDQREATCLQGLSFDNPTRIVWEAAAAVAFDAFCAAGTQVNATEETSSGYKVMGHPGVAPQGYTDFSYGRKLAEESTEKGYLP
jgi:hypothetical protein